MAEGGRSFESGREASVEDIVTENAQKAFPGLELRYAHSLGDIPEGDNVEVIYVSEIQQELILERKGKFPGPDPTDKLKIRGDQSEANNNAQVVIIGGKNSGVFEFTLYTGVSKSNGPALKLIKGNGSINISRDPFSQSRDVSEHFLVVEKK